MTKNLDDDSYYACKILVIREGDLYKNARFVMRVPLDIEDGWETCSEWDAAFEFSEFERDWFLLKIKPPRTYDFLAVRVDEEGRLVDEHGELVPQEKFDFPPKIV